MNVQDAINEIEKEYREKKYLIELMAPFAENISFVSDNGNVFFDEKCYSDNMDLLHRLFDEYGHYSLSGYYMNGNRLSLVYKFEAFNANLFCTDNDYALEKISDGRCRIESDTRRVSYVVCGVEES